MKALVLDSERNVLNIIKVESLSSFDPGPGLTLEEYNENNGNVVIGIGYKWNGTSFYDPHFTPPKPTPVVSVTPYQARVALENLGLLDEVNELLSQPEFKQAFLAWEYALEVNRNSSFISQMAAHLNLTNDEIDNLFTLASTIQGE